MAILSLCLLRVRGDTGANTLNQIARNRAAGRSPREIFALSINIGGREGGRVPRLLGNGIISRTIMIAAIVPLRNNKRLNVSCRAMGPRCLMK